MICRGAESHTDTSSSRQKGVSGSRLFYSLEILAGDYRNCLEAGHVHQSWRRTFRFRQKLPPRVMDVDFRVFPGLTEFRRQLRRFDYRSMWNVVAARGTNYHM